MNIYLPIAEISLNIILIISMGLCVGILSGMFGVGGGFLMTPLLIFVGIPPAIAVGTEAMQICGASFSGMITHIRKKNIDFRLGLILVIGGLIGVSFGINIFTSAIENGSIDLIIAFGFLIFLGSIGMLMLIESSTFLLKQKGILKTTKKAEKDTFLNDSKNKKSKPNYFINIINNLPLQMELIQSKRKVSIILPFALGLLVGLISTIMGIGGGFIIVPAMIYLLRVPTMIAIGTSLFQIVFVTAIATFLHATTNQTVDIILGSLLLIGGVIGAQIGIKFSRRFKAEELRVLLAIIVLIVCGKFALDVFIEPNNLYILSKLKLSN